MATQVWTVEQIDTESSNDEAVSTVLGVFASRDAAIAFAQARHLEDLDEEGSTIFAADGGFSVETRGEPPLFVYLGSLHTVA